MLKPRQNIRIISPESIILLLIVFVGFLMFNRPVSISPDLKKNPVSYYIPANGNYAIANMSGRIQIFQKTWISNKDNFFILAFNRNPVSENKLTGMKVSDLRKKIQSSHKMPEFLLRYHLFPLDADVPPQLS
jgi:hypothetical protein